MVRPRKAQDVDGAAHQIRQRQAPAAPWHVPPRIRVVLSGERFDIYPYLQMILKAFVTSANHRPSFPLEAIITAGGFLRKHIRFSANDRM